MSWHVCGIASIITWDLIQFRNNGKSIQKIHLQILSPSKFCVWGLSCDDWQWRCLPASIWKTKKFWWTWVGSSTTFVVPPTDYVSWMEGDEDKIIMNMNRKVCSDYEGILLKSGWICGSHGPGKTVQQQALFAIRDWSKLVQNVSKKFADNKYTLLHAFLFSLALRLPIYFATFFFLDDFM